MSVKRWNFRKAKWSHYIALTNKFAKTLLPPDSLDVDAAYQDFCNTINKAAKKAIPHGYRNNYVPCWDVECESLYKTFLQSPQGDDSSLAATALLAKLDRKGRDRRSEADRSIDFSHSSRKAWNILNNLTGRSRLTILVRSETSSTTRVFGANFYCIGSDDRVGCFYCCRRLFCWKPRNNP